MRFFSKSFKPNAIISLHLRIWSLINFWILYKLKDTPGNSGLVTAAHAVCMKSFSVTEKHRPDAGLGAHTHQCLEKSPFTRCRVWDTRPPSAVTAPVGLVPSPESWLKSPLHHQVHVSSSLNTVLTVCESILSLELPCFPQDQSQIQQTSLSSSCVSWRR